MTSILTSSIFNKKNNSFQIINRSQTLFTLPFSEEDVLDLQEIFVTLGVHVIKTKNVMSGRQVIKTILSSLNYYHDIGCVTDIEDLAPDVCDILNHIKLEKGYKDDLLINLEEFFALHPCFDFIWVEFTQSIKQQYSLAGIKNIFDTYHAQERMPVLIVMYDEE